MTSGSFEHRGGSVSGSRLPERRLESRGGNRERARAAALSIWPILWNPHNAIPFLIAGTMVVPINLVGTIRLGELILIALFPFYAKNIFATFRNRDVMIVAAAGILWLSSQVLSDLANGSPFNKFIRGWTNIALTLVNWSFFCGLYAQGYFRHVGSLLGAFVGGAFGAVYLYYLGDKSQVNSDHLWDFYVAAWAFPLFSLIAFAFYQRFPWLVMLAGIVYGVFGNIYGGRSDGLIALTSTMLFFYLWLHRGRADFRYRHVLRNAGLAAGVLLIPFFLAYVHYAKNGTLGKAAKVQIDMTKNPYNPIEVLLAARNESIIALDAIYEKPILGHGSWANPMHLRKLYLLKLREIHGARAPKTIFHDVLPVHSVLLGAWVFSGVLGFAFWVLVIYKTISLSNLLIRLGSLPVVAIVVVHLPFFCWHVMFSPHSFARFVWPASMAFLIFAAIDARKAERAKLSERLSA